MATPRLDMLPAELLHHICTYSSNPEIRSLRRVSPNITPIADEYFLENITIFYQRADLEMAESLIVKPRIAKNIRSLRFQADRLVHVYRFILWNYLRKRQINQFAILHGHLPDPDDEIERRRQTRESRREVRNAKRDLFKERDCRTNKELHLAFEQYINLIVNQAKLGVEGRPTACMAKIFEACPKLDSVIVCLGHHDDIPVVCWKSVEAFRQVLVRPWRDDISVRIGTRSANETLEAAVQAGRKLKSLTLAPVNHHFFAQEEKSMSKAYEAISNLQRIYIKIDYDLLRSNEYDHKYCRIERRMVREGVLKPEEACDCQDDFVDEDEDGYDDQFDEESEGEATQRVLEAYQDGRLSRFLSKAPDLREIRIEGPPPHDSILSLELPSIFGDHHWENLTTLDLTSFAARATELADLVLSYKSTLKTLALSHMMITGSWRYFLRAVGGQFEEFQTSRIRGFLTSDDLPWTMQYTEEFEREYHQLSSEGTMRISPEGTDRFILSGERDDLDLLLR